MRIRNTTLLLITIVISLSGFVATSGRPPQEEEDGTRRLWNQAFVAARAKRVKKPRPNDPVKPPVVGTIGSNLVGITFWRLRRAETSDPPEKARILTHEKGRPAIVQFLPERVAGETAFKEGEYVRLSIEVPREDQGFLYVIDREQYADGTLGDPYLIFPTKRLHAGKNDVLGGQVVEIPAQQDDPPYLTLERGRPSQVSERLTIIVSPKRLGLTLGEEAVKLDASVAEGWERDWGGKVEQRELKAGIGKAWTAAEKAAGQGQKELAEADPLPQTVYQSTVKPGSPLLVTVQLHIAK